MKLYQIQVGVRGVHRQAPSNSHESIQYFKDEDAEDLAFRSRDNLGKSERTEE